MTLLAGHTKQTSSPPCSSSDSVCIVIIPAGQVFGTGRLNNILVIAEQPQFIPALGVVNVMSDAIHPCSACDCVGAEFFKIGESY